ncbi:hypothetical protein [Roseimicrobium gellanilyticum]|uniref:hypothetical protein n=1 Tax=Roseimicrobium gellanilyticum TaxID=748857 RepID=UPI000DEB1DF5|nr:hypothetical protein [Roseimicrobium gellanilyticum]
MFWWFIGCGLLLLTGLALREWYHRIAAVALVTLCIMSAIESHARGIAYEKRMMAKKAARSQSS